ncbi:MAG: MFS transporter [Lachnospiraceae bacterium]
MNKKDIGYKDILKQTEYLKIILASLINRFGDSIDAIASTWIVYELTGNAAWSAIIFGANKIPSVVVTPLAGAWVEGRNKKIIMVVTDFIRAACVALVATGYLLGFLQAWMLLLTTLIISIAEAFRGPASTALTPKVLDVQYYEYGMSLNSTLSSIVELIGMAAAAGIIAVIGTAGAIYIDMITFLLSACIIVFVNSGEHQMSKQKFNAKEYSNRLKEGFRYASTNRVIRFFITIAVFLNAMLVPFNSLQAPLASEILKGGAEVLSIMGIMLTLGMLFGSLTYPMIQKVMNEKSLLVVGTLGMGLYYLGLTLCQPLYGNKWFMYAFVAVLSILFGYLVALANSCMGIALVKQVEEDYLARVGGITTALSSAATPLASFLVGAVVAYISTEMFFILAGILDVIGCILIARSKVIEAKKESMTSTEAENTQPVLG